MNRVVGLCVALVGVVLSASVWAELQSIEDGDLSEVTGQSGVYLSGDIKINEAGGPISDSYFGSCSDASKVCGARIGFKPQADGGWFVIDDLRGTIAFDGLTMQVRDINSGFDGDGAAFNRSVLEIGMPETLRFDDFNFTLAGSAEERPSAGSAQVELFGVEMSGEVTLQGNLLVFPTD